MSLVYLKIIAHGFSYVLLYVGMYWWLIALTLIITIV